MHINSLSEYNELAKAYDIFNGTIIIPPSSPS